MWKAIGAAILIPIVAIGTAQANYRDGTEFVAQCTIGADATANDRNPAPFQNEGFCLGYIMAMVDASPCNAGDVIAKNYPWNRDSDGVVAMQVARVIISWLNKHPDRL